MPPSVPPLQTCLPGPPLGLVQAVSTTGLLGASIKTFVPERKFDNRGHYLEIFVSLPSGPAWCVFFFFFQCLFLAPL